VDLTKSWQLRETPDGLYMDLGNKNEAEEEEECEVLTEGPREGSNSPNLGLFVAIYLVIIFGRYRPGFY
jgi:hypothetical protein